MRQKGKWHLLRLFRVTEKSIKFPRLKYNQITVCLCIVPMRSKWRTLSNETTTFENVSLQFSKVIKHWNQFRWIYLVHCKEFNLRKSADEMQPRANSLYDQTRRCNSTCAKIIESLFVNSVVLTQTLAGKNGRGADFALACIISKCLINKKLENWFWDSF